MGEGWNVSIGEGWRACEEMTATMCRNSHPMYSVVSRSFESLRDFSLCSKLIKTQLASRQNQPLQE
jgi:hypothetical protein